jgi:holin-like protein
MDMLRALATLLVFQCLGEGVSYLLHLPIPGPVIGMLLLLGFLSIRPRAAQAIEPTALELLRHLSLLFIPAGVGIMASAQTVSGQIGAIVVAIVVSTTAAIAVTALVTRALLNRQRRIAATKGATS